MTCELKSIAKWLVYLFSSCVWFLFWDWLDDFSYSKCKKSWKIQIFFLGKSETVQNISEYSWFHKLLIHQHIYFLQCIVLKSHISEFFLEIKCTKIFNTLFCTAKSNTLISKNDWKEKYCKKSKRNTKNYLAIRNIFWVCKSNYLPMGQVFLRLK